MTDLLSKGAAHILSRLQASAGRTVTYTRAYTGSGGSITATPGSTLFRLDDEYGATVREHRKDYIVDASDLAAVPQAGDTIVETTDDGWQRTYSVAAPDGEAVWRYADPDHKLIRIHTVETDAHLIAPPA